MNVSHWLNIYLKGCIHWITRLTQYIFHACLSILLAGINSSIYDRCIDVHTCYAPDSNLGDDQHIYPCWWWKTVGRLHHPVRSGTIGPSTPWEIYIVYLKELKKNIKSRWWSAHIPLLVMEDCRTFTSPSPLWYHRPFHSLGNLHRVSERIKKKTLNGS